MTLDYRVLTAVVEKLTIVIPTYKRGDLLAECVESIPDYAGGGPEIIIVNDSGDEQFGEEIEAECPEALIIHHEKNRGFAAAANTGIRAAKTDWVMLLNDDMVINRNCLMKLAERMLRGDVAGVAPLILDKEGDAIYAAGDRLLRNGRPESIGFRQPRESYTINETPLGITAGAALYTKEFLEDTGGFDERFIAYFEDADLCLRGRLWGYTFALVEEAVVLHVGSASIEGRTWWRTRQCMRNHLLLVAANFPSSTLLKYGPGIARELLAYVRRTFSAVRCDRGAIAGAFEVLRVYGELFTLLPHVFRKRRLVQDQREISAGQFESLLTEAKR